jgi:predicted NBD/HSP70 family sugar kinase
VGEVIVEPNVTGGTPRLLRAINERALLEAIRRDGPVSRAQLARQTGLSKPTVSLTLAGLEQAELVRVVGRSSGHVGASASLYEINPTAGWVVGVDVGRAWVRAAIADITGAFVARRDERTRTRSSSALIAQIGSIAHGLAAEAGLAWDDVTRAVVGSPGVLGPSGQKVEFAPSLPGWGRRGLVDAVRSELGTDVAFENDVNLAALGEQWAGMAGDVADFVYLSVGTGVGMGIVLRGELYRGASGAAGEVAYLPLDDDPRDATHQGPSRASRGVGSFESTASSAAVVRQARALGVASPLTAKSIFNAARRGDQQAQVVVASEARRIALVIAVIGPVLDPELVVLGGGVGGNPDLLLEPIRNELRRLSPFRPRIEVSALGEDAVLHGAVATALTAARHEVLRRATTMPTDIARRVDHVMSDERSPSVPVPAR